MEYALNVINNIQQKAISLAKELSADQLNKIPAGFNNNIAWNLGHLIVSGYSLLFRTSGVQKDYPIPFIEKYGKGSAPVTPTTPEELAELENLSNQFTQIISDGIRSGIFENIQLFTTQTFGVSVTTINELVTTIALHDVQHFEVMRNYKRILQQEHN